jgi:excisionase family DNA binding protein
MQIERRLSVAQLATIWGVSRQTVYNLVRQRKLQCVQIGDLIRFRPEDVARFEAAQCPDPAPIPQRSPSAKEDPAGTFNGGTATLASLDGYRAGLKVSQRRAAKNG